MGILASMSGIFFSFIILILSFILVFRLAIACKSFFNFLYYVIRNISFYFDIILLVICRYLIRYYLLICIYIYLYEMKIEIMYFLLWVCCANFILIPSCKEIKRNSFRLQE